MSIVKKVPTLIISYVHDYGVGKELLSSQEYMLAQDIETRMTNVFHANNKQINEKETLFKFSGIKQMELLRDRIDYLCTCKRIVGKDNAKSWVRSISREIEFEKKQISINKIFDKLKYDSSNIIEPLKKECVFVARKCIPQLPVNFEIKVTLDWDKSRSHSYGFYDEVNLTEDGVAQCEVILAMRSFFSASGAPLNLIREQHSSFKSDAEIGLFKTNIWQFHLITMFCHQAAHGIQEFCHYELDMGSEFSTHHGKGFESLYRAFRSEIVNPRLLRQKIKVGKK